MKKARKITVGHQILSRAEGRGVFLELYDEQEDPFMMFGIDEQDVRHVTLCSKYVTFPLEALKRAIEIAEREVKNFDLGE